MPGAGAAIKPAFSFEVETLPAASRVISRIAGILNTFEAAEIETIVRKIESARPVEARELRKMLFSFDDVPRLSKQALSLLFDRLSTDVVVRALVGTDAEFRDTVLSCLASRARRLVESELTTTGTVSQSEVSKARRSITELVLRMAQKNEIELPSSNTPDEPEA